LMGFGHRIYKNYDPRAKIIKQTAEQVFEVTGRNPLLDIAIELERIALQDDYFVKRKLYPNVDFYSGLIYRALGFPTEMFTVLFAIGRRPVTAGAGLETAGIHVDAKGFITVNDRRRTSCDSIYAVGDVAGQPMLAHKATHEGRLAVETILNGKAVYEPRAIPAVVFTDPEIAWCGLTEDEARRQGLDIRVAVFPWQASGRAATLSRREGITKIIADPEGGRLLGVGISGTGAGELIGEGVLAIEMGAVAEDLALTIHAHPSLSETLMEAAQRLMGQSTHYFQRL